MNSLAFRVVTVLFVPSPVVGVRSISISVSVCLFVCLHARLKTTRPNSRNFQYVLPVAVARSCCDDSAI